MFLYTVQMCSRNGRSMHDIYLVYSLFILFDYTESPPDAIDAFLKARMLAFCGLTWWRAQENLEKEIKFNYKTIF